MQFVEDWKQEINGSRMVWRGSGHKGNGSRSRRAGVGGAPRKLRC